MNTTIFTFDHGQKQLNKAIGVEESYLEELAEKCQSTVKSVIFDEDRKPKDNMSPSNLVEICANEFSYSQLVILSAFFLNEKLDQIVDKMEHSVSKMKSVIMNGDDMPEELKKFIDQLIDKLREDDNDM